MRKLICSVLVMSMIIGCIVWDMPGTAAAAKLASKGGFLEVEAENANWRSDNLELRSDPMFSGQKALAVTNEDKTEPAKDAPADLDVSFTADQAGTYSIWMLATAHQPDSGNSLFISTGGNYTTIRFKGETTYTQWTKIGSVNVANAGDTAVVKIIRRQFSYVAFDKFIMTTNADYNPETSTSPTATAKPIETSVPKIDTKNGFAMVEAESLPYNENNFQAASGANMSGGKGLLVSNEDKTMPAPNTPADIDVSFKADKPGTYAVWARQSSAGNDSAHTVFVSVGTGAYNIVSLGGTPDDFVWTKLATVTVSVAGGTGMVRIIRRQQWNTVFDKFIITDSKVFTPTGMGQEPTAPSIDSATRLPSDAYPAPTVKPISSHPRLMITKGDLPTIKSNFETEQNKAAYSEFQKLLNSGFDGNLPEAKAGSSNYNANSLATIEAYAFDYAVNVNEENGKKAISSIKNYVNTISFEGYADVYRVQGHVISVIAEVYDWCYSLLSTSDKAELIAYAESVAAGLEIGYPPNKQGAVTSHGCEQSLLNNLLGLGIATYDERPDIYNYCAGRLFAEYVPARNFWSAAHINHQGTGYGAYRGVWDYWCAWLFRKGTGVDVFSGDMQYVPYMWLYLRRPDGSYIHFGDDASDLGKADGYLSGPSSTLFFAANYYNDPYLKREFAREVPLMSTFNNLFGYYTPVHCLALNNPELGGKPVSELPLSKYFASPRGMMVARTGWNDGKTAPDVVATMNIGELWAANHEHLEAGSFQLYYKGLLASESGLYSAGYGTPHDLNYNKRSIAHNTLLIYDPNEKESYYGTTSNSGGQRVPGGGKEISTLKEWLSAGYETGKVLDREFGPDTMEPEYTYIKGDITKAYTAKVSEVLRSMVFLPLEDADHPAAMVVMDKVTAADASFKKTWLLHTLEEPSISGNITTVKRTDFGNNGKMVVETLLPKEVKIEKIGGVGKEYWVDGQNYDAKTPYDSATTPNEGQGWGRIEVSPANAAKTDYFLNVMTVGDANSAAADIKSTLIESDTLAGAVIGNRVAVFNKNAARMDQQVKFTIPGSGAFKVFVAGIKEGTWAVGDREVIVTKDGGAAYFEAAAGEVTLTYKNANAQRPEIKTPADTTDAISIRIDKSFRYSDVKPMLVDDRTLVPMRLIFEALGANITWDEATATATATKDGRTIKITDNSKTAYINDKETPLDVPAMIVNDRFLVPIRFVSEAMGAKVTWDPFANLVDVVPGRIVDVSTNPSAPKAGAATIESCQYSSFFETEVGELSYDGNPDTLWSTDGKGEWIAYKFDKEYNIASAYIQFNKASERIAYFELYASGDGATYNLIGKYKSDGKTDGEIFTFDKPVAAKFIKLVGQGNSVHNWVAIKEIEFRTQ